MLIKKILNIKIYTYYILTASIYIIIYLFITPPFYVADEYSHFQKSSSKEIFYLKGHLNIDSGIKEFSKDFENLAKQRQYNNTKYNKNFLNNKYKDYSLVNKYELANLANLSGYPVSGYIFTKLGTSIGKIFTDKVIVIFYLGRLFNLIFSVIIIYFVIKNISSNRNYLFIILCTHDVFRF